MNFIGRPLIGIGWAMNFIGCPLIEIGYLMNFIVPLGTGEKPAARDKDYCCAGLGWSMCFLLFGLFVVFPGLLCIFMVRPFFICLCLSVPIPRFFAIDNVEASFNPKFCVEVSKTLIRLAKAKNKQVIAAAQNPSILDGINLHNCIERLFVIKRNTMGHTIARRITAKPDTKTPVKLYKAWTRGYIGGLPKNF